MTLAGQGGHGPEPEGGEEGGSVPGARATPSAGNEHVRDGEESEPKTLQKRGERAEVLTCVADAACGQNGEE